MPCRPPYRNGPPSGLVARRRGRVDRGPRRRYPRRQLSPGPFALFFADINRELVSLNLKARIGHHDVPGENADRFRRIEDGLVGINLGDDLLRAGGGVAAAACRLALLFGLTFTAFPVADGVLSEAGRGEREESVAGAEPWPRLTSASTANESIAQTTPVFLIPVHPWGRALCPGPPSSRCPPASPAG